MIPADVSSTVGGDQMKQCCDNSLKINPRTDYHKFKSIFD